MDDGTAKIADSELPVEPPVLSARACAGPGLLASFASSQAALLVLGAFSVLLGYWFKVYLRSGYIASIDLPGHMAIIERMITPDCHLRLFFFDPGWFSGWAAFQFYAFLAHAFTAILSLTLLPWTDSPVRLACHLLLWLGCVGFPFSVYYFALPLARQTAGAERLSITDRSILAMASGFVSFWFLNHDYEWNGVGGGAALYIGLYSQIFAWHLLLWHAGAMFRLLLHRTGKYEVLVCVAFAALILTHTLTSLFVLAVVFLLSMWLAGDRLMLWRIHLVSFGLSAFWFVPALAFSNAYAVAHIEWPSGDFFEMFFRYPLAALLGHAKAISSGTFQAIDLGTLEMDLFFVLFLVLAGVRRSMLAIAMFAVIMSCAFLFSSDFVAASLPVTFHYYRSAGYVFVYLAGLLSVVPMVVCHGLSVWFARVPSFRWIPALLIVGLLSAGVYSMWSFPHSQRELVEQSTNAANLRSDNQVLEYFKRLPDKGRVFFESYKETARSKYRLARYAESHLLKETGFETTSGLFIQSSLANQLVSQVAVRGGARTWSCPLYKFENADHNASEVARQLREFGVTHVVCDPQSGFYRNLEPFHVDPIAIFEPYAIIPIAAAPCKKVDGPRKAILGYIDRLGTLPFKLVEYYVSAHPKVNQHVDLIDLTGRNLPGGLSGILLNDRIGRDTQSGELSDDRFAGGVPVLRICFQREKVINHYNVEYHCTVDDVMCRDVDYFFNNFDLAQEVSKLAVPVQNSDQALSPCLTWLDDFQTMELSNLQPNHFVRVNYSYFPFWRSTDAAVYRGSGERMFVLPRGTHATVRYEPLCSPLVQIGIALSLLSVLALPGVRNRSVAIIALITAKLSKVIGGI